LQDNASKNKVSAKLASVHSLPTMPALVSEVSQLIDDPLTSAARLSKLISKDQGMATKILSVANSPLYGIPRRVSTVDFAILILGFNHIKNIVIALSMMDAFKTLSTGDFKIEEYWKHSLMIATAAKRIATDLGYQFSGEAFTAGLLHDLGIPIIYNVFKNEYDQIEKIIEETGSISIELENEILGASHAFIGQYLTNHWNLPEEISMIIAEHHKPSNANRHVKILTSVVHFADYITSKLEIGTFRWDSGFELDTGIIEILKLGSIDYLNGLVDSYKDLLSAQLDTLK